jgi:hypothetical protein
MGEVLKDKVTAPLVVDLVSAKRIDVHIDLIDEEVAKDRVLER